MARLLDLLHSGFDSNPTLRARSRSDNAVRLPFLLPLFVLAIVGRIEGRVVSWGSVVFRRVVLVSCGLSGEK